MPKVTDKNIVLKAMVEFKELGREAFLEKYHFGKAKSTLLFMKGKNMIQKLFMASPMDCSTAPICDLTPIQAASSRSRSR